MSAPVRSSVIVRNSAISGVIAFAIYRIIALATGGSVGASIGIGVLVGLAVFAISFAVNTWKVNRRTI